jgi:hypothetical protein
MNVQLSESQMKSLVFQNNEYSRIIKIVESFDDEAKLAVVEYLKILYPNNTIELNESAMDWIQTAGDVIGIFDPTGVVDLVNGVIYFSRGQKFFGILSMISAIPYIGDAIAKPIKGYAMASKGVKGLEVAMATGKTTKVANEILKGDKAVKTLANSTSKWAQPLINLLEKGKRIPLIGRFFNLISDWIKLFTAGAKEASVAGKTSSSVRLFRDFNVDKMGKITKFFRNIGWWRNPQLSKLILKTKFWGRFLDYMGITKFTTPEQLVNKYGEETIKEKMEEFSNTREGDQLFKDEMSGKTTKPIETTPQTTQIDTTPVKSGGGIDDFFGKLINFI